MKDTKGDFILLSLTLVANLTPAISRRAHNLESIQVSRVKATLFLGYCMALLDLAFKENIVTIQALFGVCCFWSEFPRCFVVSSVTLKLGGMNSVVSAERRERGSVSLSKMLGPV